MMIMNLSEDEKEKFSKALQIVDQYKPEQWFKRFKSIFIFAFLIVCSCYIPTLAHIQHQIVISFFRIIIPCIFIVCICIQLLKTFIERENFDSASEYINSIIPSYCDEDTDCEKVACKFYIPETNSCELDINKN